MTPFSEQERQEIREHFGVSPEQLDAEAFRKTLRELRAKYHPDNFEKFGDDTVRQLATERFQRIERLAEKIENWLSGISVKNEQPRTPPGQASRTGNNQQPIFGPLARFAYKEMKIEIRTSDKDLKYHLFGTFYRWLMLGDRFKIPETNAFLIADEDYRGRNIGFTEFIRVYLTFEESDSVETIAQWFFSKIEGRADALLIEGELVPIEYEALLFEIKRRSLKMLTSEVA
jgi:hypothetical protein